MTEAEAGTKWCPFVRAAYPGGMASHNRGLQELDDDRLAVYLQMAQCVGSKCMMWREDAFQPTGDCGLKSH